MSNVSRRGGLAGVAAGLAWIAALVYLMLDELEYSGRIVSNPFPTALGLPALMLAAAATAVALRAVWAAHPPTGLGGKLCFGVAYLGAAISLVPLWPAVFLGPLLLMVGLTLLGWSAIVTGGSDSQGHRVHAIGLPAIALTAPLLDRFEVMDGGVGLAVAVILMAGGLAWIGVDLNAGERRAVAPTGVTT